MSKKHIFTFCIFVCPFLFPHGIAQQDAGVSEGLDPALYETNPFLLSPIEKNKERPLKAALLSSIFPGAGQIYNGKLLYVRLPIIYGAAVVMGLIIDFNQRQYVDLRDALIFETDNDPNTSASDVRPEFAFITRDGLFSNRNNIRTNRDIAILVSFLIYGLNIADAAVGAHLSGFDVSEDLSLHFEPAFENVAYGYNMAPVFSLKASLKFHR